MTTPEGKIKNTVKALLHDFRIYPAKDAGKPLIGPQGWYFCPGQTGYSTKGIPDFIGHYLGYFWSVETKAPGKEPTGFQKLQIGMIQDTGGAVFVVDGEESLHEFREWLHAKNNK